MKPIVEKLPSGHWCVRLGGERFAQWPHGRTCAHQDCFPEEWWTTHEVDIANAAVDAWQEARKG